MPNVSTSLMHPQFRNLSGRTFGRWEVLSYGGKQARDHYWHCRCVCGVESIVNGGNLLRGTSTSCGCYRAEIVAERRFKDLTGQRFDRLIVAERAANRGRFVRWLCRCDCGKQITVDAQNLRKRFTKSCGCLRDELVSVRRRSPDQQA